MKKDDLTGHPIGRAFAAVFDGSNEAADLLAGALAKKPKKRGGAA